MPWEITRSPCMHRRASHPPAVSSRSHRAHVLPMQHDVDVQLLRGRALVGSAAGQGGQARERGHLDAQQHGGLRGRRDGQAQGVAQRRPRQRLQDGARLPSRQLSHLPVRGQQRSFLISDFLSWRRDSIEWCCLYIHSTQCCERGRVAHLWLTHACQSPAASRH
jgi:hypothetical protein